MATTGMDGVTLLWNSFVGLVLAFALPPSLRHSCCDTCPHITRCGARRTATSSGVRNDDNGKLNESRKSIIGANIDPKLVEDWSSTLWWSLKLDVSHSLCSKELKLALFARDPEIIHQTNSTTKYRSGDDLEKKNGIETKNTTWIVSGIPERPLYKEVAKRLLEWNQLCVSQSSSQLITGAFTDTSNCRIMVPAQALGFEEMLASSKGRILLPELPPMSTREIPNWLLSSRGGDTNADNTIYKLLGIRNTAGSLLPSEKRLLLLPSKRALMEAAGAFLEPKQKLSARNNSKRKHQRLTVAAKARSKHAPRAIRETSFFGVARGPVTKQNQEAEALVQHLLQNCVWINCHVFGGLTKTQTRESTNSTDNFSSWVVELRQEHGYGARWRVEEYGNSKNCSFNNERSSHPTVMVTFRGFLEPQMEDGHECRWRH